MKEKVRLHSFDVAIDYCAGQGNAIVVYAMKKGEPYIKVHAFSVKGDMLYVAYTMATTETKYSYTTDNDFFGNKKELLDWIVKHTDVKTLRGADSFLHKLIWAEGPLHFTLDDGRSVRLGI